MYEINGSRRYADIVVAAIDRCIERNGITKPRPVEQEPDPVPPTDPYKPQIEEHDKELVLA